jgi:hypothetical protein
MSKWEEAWPDRISGPERGLVASDLDAPRENGSRRVNHPGPGPGDRDGSNVGRREARTRRSPAWTGVP